LGLSGERPCTTSPSSSAEVGFLGEGNNEDFIWLYNSDNKPRIANLRWHFLYKNKDEKPDLDELIEAFKQYYNFDEYAIIKYQVTDAKHGNVVSEKVFAVKTRKRGNAKWLKSVKSKLYGLVDYLANDLTKFHKRSNLLFITNTYDPKKFSFKQAWTEGNEYYNRFRTNLQNKFGKIDYVKAVQIMADGKIHFHTIAHFKETSFEIFKHRSKKTGRITWRIKDYDTVLKIKDCWKMGNTDIEAIYSKKGVVYYISKALSYLNKDSTIIITDAINELKKKYGNIKTMREIMGNEKLLNELVEEIEKSKKRVILGLALASLYRRQNYNMSRSFYSLILNKKLYRLDTSKRFSNFFSNNENLENVKILEKTSSGKLIGLLLCNGNFRTLIKVRTKVKIKTQATGNANLQIEKKILWKIEEFGENNRKITVFGDLKPDFNENVDVDYYVVVDFGGMVTEPELASYKEAIVVD